MNRRSEATMLNPCPTGAPPGACCAWTVGVKIGLPMPGRSIASAVTIAHGLADRIRRHVKGFRALIIGSSFQWRWRVVLRARFFAMFDSLVLHEPVAAVPVGAPADDDRAPPSGWRRRTKVVKWIECY